MDSHRLSQKYLSHILCDYMKKIKLVHTSSDILYPEISILLKTSITGLFWYGWLKVISWAEIVVVFSEAVLII